MRIRVLHDTNYHFDQPAKGMIQTLRVTPGNHDGQYVIDWRIDVSGDCRLDSHEDAFGNIMHAFTIEGPLERLRISVEGEVETQDTNGVVRGTIEHFPPSLYLRETSLTEPDATLIEFACDAVTGTPGDPLASMHALLARVHEDIAFDGDAAKAASTATETLARKSGVGSDLAHVFITAARCLAVPARYVGGYVQRGDGIADAGRAHAWAEAHIDGLGWVAFDPVNKVCGTEAHIRVGVGLDSLGAAPIRGTRYGGEGERVDVSVRVDQASRQTQS